MLRKSRQRLTTSVLGGVAALFIVSMSAQAAVVQYEGQLRYGFSDKIAQTSTVAGTRTEPLDTANNGVPPCQGNFPTGINTTITPGGGINAISMQTATAATINFFGLADVTTAGPGVLPTLNLPQATPTANGFGFWGLQTNCPKWINGVPGAGLFRRTQMATFSFPATSGSLASGGGPGLAATAGGNGLKPFIPWATTAPRPRQDMNVVAKPGGAKYGGSAVMLGRGDTILGIFLTAAGLGLQAGPLPIQIAVGIGSTGTQGFPTATNMLGGPTDAQFFQLPSTGAPLPVTPNGAPTSNAVLGITGFAQGAGVPWSTGIVTAYDRIGNFVTTRTRTGDVDFTGPFTGATSGFIQAVSPNVLNLGLPIGQFGIALTAEMDIKLVPEPAAAGMLVAGIGLLGAGALVARRRQDT